MIAPFDTRGTPASLTDAVGAILVADARRHQARTRSSGVTSFDTGTGSKNWIDVAVDRTAARVQVCSISGA